MDWKALLKKYMDYVDTVEGAHFVREYRRSMGDFTNAEWAMLKSIAEEIDSGT